MKALSSLILTALLLVPSLARADHGPPAAADVPARIAQYAGDLDDLADEYFLEPGDIPNFDEPRFNRLVGHARILVERARVSLDRGDLCRSVVSLYQSIRVLDHATNFAISANMSGSGHSDDLASLSTFRLETLLEDLIVLTGADGSVPAFALTIAARLDEAGDNEITTTTEGTWSVGARYYALGVCVIARFL